MTTPEEQNLRRWVRRQLRQPTPEREHLEAAVEAGDVEEVRRLVGRFPFTKAQRAHVEQLLDAWETQATGKAAASPLVRELHWGRVDTDAGSFRDAKLWPGGGRGWDWNETGTSHVPGVQPADVLEVLDHGATTVLLSQGQQQRLQVPEDTLTTVGERGAEAVVLPTGEAIERYNELAEAGDPVGALLHSTC